MSNLYQGKRVALLTQHGKERLIAPIIEPPLGCQIVHTSDYDTDLLGTFSGEVKRLDSQINTARAKAKIGMELTSSTVGIANEGAFVPDPFSGLTPWNIEVTIWIDEEQKLEVLGIAQGPARDATKSVKNIQDLEKFAYEAGFPEHQLILRTETLDGLKVQKGISDWATLINAFYLFMNASKNQRVEAESDLRAFCNATRQRMIEKSTQDLLTKLKSSCPACSTPGFSVTRHEPGLPCQACGKPTKLALRYKWTCNSCHFHEHKLTSDLFAKPSFCDICNP